MLVPSACGFYTASACGFYTASSCGFYARLLRAARFLVLMPPSAFVAYVAAFRPEGRASVIQLFI